ncbi:hypothetical protein [Petrimonas sulfuriphila]|uniref:hypothetical protein n=1 Tax=Petrimonas sulfuriphila TaxID=285070 RepID=UPI003EBA7A47
MDSEQILSQIKEKVGQTDVSDRTMMSYIDKHLPKDQEPDDKFYEAAVDIFKSFQGNMSNFAATTVKQQAEAKIEEFKKNYKPSPTPSVETPPKGDDELAKRLEAIEQALQNEKKANAINSLRSDVKAKADGLKVANKAIWNDVVDSISVKDEATSEELLSEVKKTYEKKLKEYTGEGATPYGGSQRTGAQQVSTEEAKAKRDEFKKKMQSAGRLPKPTE